MQRKRAALIAIVVVAAAALATLGYTSFMPARERLIVSTTTSLYETGLLDVVKMRFERIRPELRVSFISQGTGLAIQTAVRGDADVILVHDSVKEFEFMQSGYGVNRKVIAYNFFVVVGPSDDPADVKGRPPTEALRVVKTAGEEGRATWVSRGDDSGTHARERQIWSAAGLDVENLRREKWYVEAGSGMAATLRMATEKRAYTLTDMASFLMNVRKGGTDLEIVVEAGKDLLNVYSAVASDPRNANMRGANFDGAMAFIEFLVSDEGQEILEGFGKEDFGRSLFYPYVKHLKTRADTLFVRWVQETAYFDGTECPEQYRYRSGSLYQALPPGYHLILPVSRIE